MIKTLLFIGGLWGIATAYPYLISTPPAVITYNLTKDLQAGYQNVLSIWNKIKPKDANLCANIKGKYPIKIKQPLSFFMGRRVIGQMCLPVSKEKGCYAELQVNERQAFIFYSGQQCLVSGFK